jgi:putative membrane protein
VPSRIDKFFSKQDRAAISEATAEAERQTSGELVVYVVERCDPYGEEASKGALVGGAIGALVGALAAWFYGGWGAPDELWILIGAQVGLLLGWLASRIEGVARALIGGEAMESRADGRAAEAFVEERVFATEARTGVLIFLALFEHRVIVMADEGISAAVPESAWDDIAGSVASGIRAGSPTSALIDAVKRCADILSAHGVPANQTNELSNKPRFRDE